MSLRLSEKVKLSVNVPEPEDDKGLMIAPLMFITLIENAFKHGVNPIGESKIYILIKITDSNIISCKIENSFFPKTEEDRSGSGIGLDNLKKRLNLIYPGKYTLKSERVGDFYVSELNITVS
jgi:LytS/YehU family sensor histidine kinase